MTQDQWNTINDWVGTNKYLVIGGCRFKIRITHSNRMLGGIYYNILDVSYSSELIRGHITNDMDIDIPLKTALHKYWEFTNNWKGNDK